MIKGVIWKKSFFPLCASAGSRRRLVDQFTRRQTKVISEKGKIWTLYSEIGSRPVMWLWKPYIPLGKVTLLQAEFSEIITSFLTGFLSEVSKGGNTPDGGNESGVKK